MNTVLALVGIVRVAPGFGGGINDTPVIVSYVSRAIVGTRYPSCSFPLWKWTDAVFVISRRLTYLMFRMLDTV